MFEIKEKILEPSKIYAGSSFLLKIRVKNTSKLLRVKDINFMFVKDYNITPVNLLSTTKSLEKLNIKKEDLDA